VLVFAVHFFAPECPAQTAAPVVPRLIRFSGTIHEVSSKPVREVAEIAFSLFKEESGGAPLWFESQTVEVDAQGRYTVLLGAMHPDGLPMDLFTSGEARWLSIMVGKVEQQRVLIVSVPYALKAGDAETLGGKPAAAYLLAVPTTSTSLSTAATEGSHVDTSKRVQGSVDGPAPLATSGTAGYIAKFINSTDLGNSVMFESNEMIGIGTTSPAKKLTVVDSRTYSSGTTAAVSSAHYGGATVNGSSTNYIISLQADATDSNISSGVTDSGYRMGVRADAFTNNASNRGTIASQYGIQGRAGIYSTGAGGRVTNAYAGRFDVLNNDADGTIENAYGVYITNDQTTGTITNRYDLYAASTLAKSYFAGNVGIGTSSPTTKLEVNGTAKFNDVVTFAAAQTFSGNGSGLTNLNPANLSSGTAGISITGNAATATSATSAATATSATTAGTATNALNLNGVAGTSYARLDITNTFAANQTVNGNVGIGTAPTRPLDVVGSGTTQAALKAVGVTASSIGGVFSTWRAGIWGDSASGNGILASSDSTNAIVARNNVTGALPTAFLQNNNSGGQALGAGGPLLGCIIYANGYMACGAGKAAEVGLTDGRKVLLFAVESPEIWFEDFGSAALAAGIATVAFDPVFADTVNLDLEYRVFLTPRGDCEGLYVASQSSMGFEVRELRGGKSDVAFDYRVIAHRKGYEDVRLMDVTESSYEKVRAASLSAARSE
jgi:hypothetical protein